MILRPKSIPGPPVSPADPPVWGTNQVPKLNKWRTTICCLVQDYHLDHWEEEKGTCVCKLDLQEAQEPNRESETEPFGTEPAEPAINTEPDEPEPRFSFMSFFLFLCFVSEAECEMFNTIHAKYLRRVI